MQEFRGRTSSVDTISISRNTVWPLGDPWVRSIAWSDTLNDVREDAQDLPRVVDIILPDVEREHGLLQPQELPGAAGRDDAEDRLDGEEDCWLKSWAAYMEARSASSSVSPRSSWTCGKVKSWNDIPPRRRLFWRITPRPRRSNLERSSSKAVAALIIAGGDSPIGARRGVREFPALTGSGYRPPAGGTSTARIRACQLSGRVVDANPGRESLAISGVICGPDTRSSRKRGSRARCARPAFVTPATHPA